MGIREDHSRFRDIVRGRIKQNFKKYVTHGEMIGKRENDIVKIPVPSIDIPRFKYGPKQRGGVGQGGVELDRDRTLWGGFAARVTHQFLTSPRAKIDAT